MTPTEAYEEAFGEVPTPDELEDAYVGHWESFLEYASEVADETMVYELDEHVKRYFDYDSYARDLSFDYYTADDAFGVHIFRAY